MEGKLIIFSAPSGSGKTTIVNALLERVKELEFSVSATSRKPRNGETEGKDYYFISPKEFRQKADKDEFIEWEEVYEDTFYGTLRSEVIRIWSKGKHVIFDIDVAGGIRLKNIYGEKALAIFVHVPDLKELEKRLRNRSTESEEDLSKRLAKAQEETQYAGEFDVLLINQDLEASINEAERIVRKFIDD